MPSVKFYPLVLNDGVRKGPLYCNFVMMYSAGRRVWQLHTPSPVDVVALSLGYTTYNAWLVLSPSRWRAETEWRFTSTRRRLFLCSTQNGSFWYWPYAQWPNVLFFMDRHDAFRLSLVECFSTAGQQPSTRPWHQLYRAARGLRKHNMLQDFISSLDK